MPEPVAEVMEAGGSYNAHFGIKKSDIGLKNVCSRGIKA
jgi:hypothetical protein